MSFVLARLSLARLTRTRRSWFPFLGWSAVAIGTALLARANGHPNGADYVLRGNFGFIVLPLLAYSMVSAALGGMGLKRAIGGLVTLGASPRRAALVTVLVAMLSTGAAAAVVALCVCLLAHGSADAPLSSDVPATLGVAFAGGATYAAYFCAGSAIGRGAMRGLFLGLDWLLGASGGLGATLVPRGHVRSLLGGAPCFDLSRRTSSVLLMVLLVACLFVALRLARRVR